jgi:2-oxoglutarate ferredoxin oxidoreductase subunit beta
MTNGTPVKEEVVSTPKLRTDVPYTFCPGCHYGIVGRLLCEVIEEMGIGGKTVGLVSAGCYVMMPSFIDIDWVSALHGRAPAVATGIKRTAPDLVVVSLQGDGDLGAIGMGHFMNAMMRGEPITTIFLNNAGYGMTGGQMAPTTLVGMRTTTTPYGRKPAESGYPLHAAEVAATMKGVAYSARTTVHKPANYTKTKKMIRTAIRKQVGREGFSLVEILSACPSNWGMSPVECLSFIENQMIAEYPLGEFKS